MFSTNVKNLQKQVPKVRGACNKIANLTEKEKANGVIASSAETCTRCCIRSENNRGIKATIVMPATAPLAKVTGYGAEVVLND